MKLLDEYIMAYHNMHMANVVKNAKYFEMERYLKTEFDLNYWQVTQIFWFIEHIAYETFVNVPTLVEEPVIAVLTKLGYSFVEGENGYIVYKEDGDENQER